MDREEFAGQPIEHSMLNGKFSVFLFLVCLYDAIRWVQPTYPGRVGRSHGTAAEDLE
jgi:hypothetical protein